MSCGGASSRRCRHRWTSATARPENFGVQGFEPPAGYEKEGIIVESIEPKAMPELRKNLVEWTHTVAPWLWLDQHLSGTKFWLPPATRGLPLPQAFSVLAENYATLLTEARLYSSSPEMTFLALKTSMPRFHLTLGMLPAPKGFIVWQRPIGVAEHTQRMQIKTDPESGDVISASLHEWVEGITDEDVPVVGASWELSEDQDNVFVVFYSKPSFAVMERGLTPAQFQRMRALMSPLAFEREQILPVDRELGWFTSQDEDRLRLTVGVDVDKVPASLRDDAIRRNNNVLPDLDQMTRALVATWMLMKMRFARVDVVLPDRAGRKQLGRAGVSAESIDSGVQVIKLGGPLRQQKPRNSEPAFRWKSRRIVGPFVRNQWYPSEETHKPKLVEPYIAGPEGAPIGNAEKVYLLG